MDKRKTSAKIGMIICLIVGLCLIFTGIFIPRAMKKRTFEYTEDFEFDKMYYEFEIDTKEKLDVDTGKVKIKVQGTNKETFEIYFDKEESDTHEGEYVFVTLLLDDDASIFNELIEIEIYNESGKLLTFTPESMGSNFSVLPLTIFPIFFGVVIIVFGIIIFLSKNARVLAESTLATVQTIAPQTEIVKVKEEDKTITCKYCGLENDRNNAKCEHCGGPLFRK